MKRFGIGLLAAGMLAAATLLTSLPASARGAGGGMIWIPPMGGGMGGGGMGGGWGNGPGGGVWHGGGMGNGGNWGGGPNGAWHGPGGNPGGGNNYHGGKPYNGQWNGWNGNNWHGKNWNNNWNNNWYRNGRWYGPRYRYRYPGYNYYYGGFWYPWPWWSNVWNFQTGDNYGYWGGYTGGGGYGSRHVAWCRGRYRSYNPNTNTFTGYDGLQHRCNSPYD